MTMRRVIALLILSLAGHAARGQSIHIIQPADGYHDCTVRALSDTGSVAYGDSSDIFLPRTGFSWTLGTGRMEFAGPGVPRATSVLGCSGDGSASVGTGSNVNTRERAFRYQNGVYTDLGVIGTHRASYAVDANYDGSVVIGNSTANGIGTASKAFRWTAQTGMVDLGRLRANQFLVGASAVSRDGNTIIGACSDNNNPDEAFVWTAQQGMRKLADLPNSTFGSGASCISADGQIIVGTCYTNRSSLVVWRSGAVEDLGLLRGSSMDPQSVSDDGAVIVGRATDLPVDGGFIWTASSGMELLTDYLSRNGVQLPAGWVVGNCSSVSGDGKTFAGYLTRSGGEGIGFVATIPAPGWALVFPCSSMVVARRRRRA